jgi:hypothetical protein
MDLKAVELREVPPQGMPLVDAKTTAMSAGREVAIFQGITTNLPLGGAPGLAPRPVLPRLLGSRRGAGGRRRGIAFRTRRPHLRDRADSHK